MAFTLPGDTMDMSAESSSSSFLHDSNRTDHYRIYECFDLPLTMIMSVVMGTLTIVLGVPLNARVLWIGRLGELGTSDIFVLNLTFIQAIFCLINPVFCMSILFSNTTLGYIELFSHGLVLVGRALSQCCICVERYLAVVHPIFFLKTTAKKYAKYRAMCLVAIWLVTLVFCVIIVRRFPVFPITELCLPFLTVLVINSFCSFSMMRALYRPGPGDGRKDGMHDMKRHASWFVLILLLLNIIIYVPYFYVGFLQSKLTYTERCIGYCTAYAIIAGSTIVQPLMFLSKREKLQCLHCPFTCPSQIS